MKQYGFRVYIVGYIWLVFGGIGQLAFADEAGSRRDLFSGESTETTPNKTPENTVSKSNTSPILHYKIGVGDNVRVHVWRNADLSTSVPVRPDGYISMPLLGDIKARGLKPTELAEDIRKKLSSYLRDPRVSVIMQGLSSNEYINRVRVTGAVNRPTSIPFREGMTVLDLILDTGGVSQFASPNKTKIFRKNNGKSEVLKVRLNDILEKADLKTNYAIIPGDVITVPERLF